jgi:hypothetical protein
VLYVFFIGALVELAAELYIVYANGDFAIAISGGCVLLLGIVLFMDERLGTRLRRGNTAELQRG